MLLTFKILHKQDFRDELALARIIAEHAVETKSKSSKTTNHIDLPSAIRNQIQKKYAGREECKKVSRVKITIPGNECFLKNNDSEIYVRCLKLVLPTKYIKYKFDKVNQIELDEKLAYVTISVSEATKIPVTSTIGVDRNTTGHVVVAANLESGKILKLGKNAKHIRTKFRNLRSRLQRSGNFKRLKLLKDKESRIMTDMNHKMSRRLVDWAIETNSVIVLENLKGIRKAKSGREGRRDLNSWSFYQFATFVEYKAKLAGVKVYYVDPAYTSQICSICGKLGKRDGKKFKCENCGHTDHADVNAAFNIAERYHRVKFHRDAKFLTEAMLKMADWRSQGEKHLVIPLKLSNV